MLERFLRALDIAPRAIPTELEARAALYRSLLADRRVLVLLDNAATVAQVRPLLPGNPECLVLLTSRSRLSGLVVRDGAQRLTLDLLPEPDAVSLLRALTARYRGDESAERLTELARLCARLPLALRIAAERAASRPQMPIEDLIADLRDESALWDALTAEDDDEFDAVRTVFAWSYRALTDPAARMFRLVGLHPGPDFSAEAAAALAQTTLAAARSQLDLLVGAHLLEQTGPDRYQFHDLLRAYAVDQVHEESREVQHAATRRVLTWYLHTANAAEARVGALDLRITLDPADPALRLPAFADTRAASAWLDAERPNLVAATRVAAADPDLHDLAWRLPTVLRSYFMRHNLFEDWLSTAHLGLTAARSLGDPRGEVELLDSLGVASVATDQLTAAVDYHTQALTLRRELGDRRGEAVTLNALGLTALRRRDLSEAIGHFTACAATFDQLGDAVWQAVAQANLGEAQYERADLAQAAESVRDALAVFRTEHDAQGEGNALRILSAIHREQGHLAEARQEADDAVTIAVDQQNRMWEGYWLLELAAAQRATGNTGDALVSDHRAATVQRRLGDRNREARALDGAGLTYQLLDRPDEAADFHRRAVALLQTLADPWHLALALDHLADALTAAGRPEQAQPHRRQALVLLTPLTDPRAVSERARVAAAVVG